MKRRRFIVYSAGVAAAWPLAALAQPAGQIRRVGVLTGLAQSDLEAQERVAAFRERLQKLGWTEGGNLRIITRWAAGDIARTRAYAAELVDLAPDVILVNTPPGLAALQTATRRIPVVFVQVVDAAEGTIKSPAHPGGNVTGFYTVFDYSIAGKWLELLKEVAPRIRRVAAMQDPKHPAWSKYLSAVKDVAPSLGIEVIPAPVQEPAEIERAIDMLAREPDGGLIVLPDSFTAVHRGRIIAAAARYRLPAVSHLKGFAAAGGLMSYGADLVDLVGQAASYVDRILRGRRPAELPVQASTKFELVVNLNTARAFDLKVPQTILLRADRVIE